MVKNPLANARDVRDMGLTSGSGRTPGGEHGNPLQSSSLENPMDREAWWATAHRVTKSWTRLMRLSMHASMHPSTAIIVCLAAYFASLVARWLICLSNLLINHLLPTCFVLFSPSFKALPFGNSPPNLALHSFGSAPELRTSM